MKLTNETREVVQRRAQNACEYCHLPQGASILPHQIGPIPGQQSERPDDAENLCVSCLHCNLKKGPNLTSIDPGTHVVVELFHPRRHSWQEHFHLSQDGVIHGRTPEGRATVQRLDMNDAERTSLRELLLRRNQYP